MIYIADSTYLTHAAVIDVQILEKVQMHSIEWAIVETGYNLHDEVARTKMRQFVKIITRSKAGVERQGYENLSQTDGALLQTCIERKSECALVTDDGLLALAAARNSIKVFSMPEFLENRVKKDRVSKAEALDWLKGLKEIYPRKKTIEKTIRRIEEY